MKKQFFLFSIALSAIVAMYSCNNGEYDANPDRDYSSAVNPLGNGDDTTAAHIGTMYAWLNSKQRDFHPAYSSVDENGITTLTAKVIDDTLFERTLKITFAEFKGVLSYNIPPEPGTSPLITVTLTMVDTSRVDKAGRKIYKTYSTTANGATAQLVIDGDEGGFYRGTLDAYMSRVLPETNVSDTMKIENGHFYFDKKDNLR